MRRTKQQLDEVRFRIKGTVGLVVLGAFLGAVAWLWRAAGGGGDIDIVTLARVLSISAGNVYFWVVVSLCAVLGGWLAWLIFWRGRVADGQPQERGPDGMSAPKF